MGDIDVCLGAQDDLSQFAAWATEHGICRKLLLKGYRSPRHGHKKSTHP
jgi:hypothetical protein